MINYKSTSWITLSIHDCEILEIGRVTSTGYISHVRIRHPKMKYPRAFTLSQADNLYSRYTGGAEYVNCIGYIIKDWQELINDREEK